MLAKMLNSTNLVLTSPEDYPVVTLELIKYLSQDKKGVYVTTNKPFMALRSLLEKEGVSIDKLIFIDCISRTLTDTLRELKEASAADEKTNCFFVRTPENLTDISIGIVEAIDKNPDFLFFDSLSTLLLYNDAKNVARFAHFLIGKMRIKNVVCVFIMVENPEENGFICHISEFFDMILKIRLKKRKWTTKKED